MICKAIIESVIDNGYNLKIRIPMLDKLYKTMAATANDKLLTAPVMTLPGIIPAYQKGDIVFVAFEDEDLSRPVVIGRLHRKSGVNSSADIIAQSVKVMVNLDYDGNNKNNNAQLQFIQDQINDLYNSESGS